MDDFEENAMEDEVLEGSATETKSERFLRLAPPRVNKVIKGVEALGKLGNRSSYEYTEEQVEKMFSAIRCAIDSAEEHFKPKSSGKGSNFTF